MIKVVFIFQYFIMHFTLAFDHLATARTVLLEELTATDYINQLDIINPLIER